MPVLCRNRHCFFFFNDTATTEIYTLSLHDALPIYRDRFAYRPNFQNDVQARFLVHLDHDPRSEEHTSELQSQFHLVCRLLLEKKKKHNYINELYYKKSKITTT